MSADREHHTGLTGRQVAEAIVAFMDAWERSECHCCSPNAMEDAFDALPLTEEFGARMTRIGVEFAQAGYWVTDQEREAAQQVPGSGASEPGGAALTEANATTPSDVLHDLIDPDGEYPIDGRKQGRADA